MTWVPRKDDTPYTVSIYLVEKLTPEDLLKKLKLKGQRDPQVTRNVITAKLEDKDDEISTSSVKVSMGCPLSMTRMSYPCRASTCDHLQCFDADMYIKMNEKKPKWVCPVCNKPAYFEHLFLDGFYIQLLLSPKFKALSTNEIILNNDASWEAVEETALGVSDSDDDYAEPAPVKKLTTNTNNSNGYTTIDDDDISVIPIAPMTDSDGAPILTSTAIPNNVPTNNTLASNHIMSPTSGTVTLINKQRDLDDDVLAEEDRLTNQEMKTRHSKVVENDNEALLNRKSADVAMDVIRVYGFRKAYTTMFGEPFLAVEKISFGLDYGECFALLGVNGAGKTTLFKSLTRDIEPTEGSITIAGYNIQTEFSSARKLIGYCP